MKVLASYLLSISSSRSILSTVHRKGFNFSSCVFRNSSTSNDVSTPTRFIETSKVYNCESTWAIQNFRLLNGCPLITGDSFSPKDIKYEWFLELSSNKGNSSNDSYLNLGLKPSDKTIQKFGGASGEIEFALIDADGEKSCVEKKFFTVEQSTDRVLIDNFIKLTDLFDACDTRSLLPGGTLTIYCQVSFILLKEIDTTVENDSGTDLNSKESSDEESSNEESSSDSTTNPQSKDDPKNIPEKEITDNDDVNNRSTDSTGIGKYDESKSVIPAKYLDHDRYPDYEQHDYEEILRHIYTLKAKNFQSQKYEIDELKKMCEVEIAEMLSNETAVEILVFSEIHTLDNLQEKSIEYITKNFQKVVEANRKNGLTSHELMKYLGKKLLGEFSVWYSTVRGNW